jgi:hypothetical protein
LNSYEVRRKLISDLSNCLFNIQKKSEEFDENLYCSNEFSLYFKTFFGFMSTVRNYNTLAKSQEMIIKFEKCNYCYENVCNNKDLCTDMISLMNKLVVKTSVKAFKSIYRLIYHLREINLNLIELDNHMFNGSLLELAKYRIESIDSQSTVLIETTEIVDYEVVKKIEDV